MGEHLIGMHLIGTHLTGVNPPGLYLTGMHLTGVNLMGVHLISVHLFQASISQALRLIGMCLKLLDFSIWVFGKSSIVCWLPTLGVTMLQAPQENHSQETLFGPHFPGPPASKIRYKGLFGITIPHKSSSPILNDIVVPRPLHRDCSVLCCQEAPSNCAFRIIIHALAFTVCFSMRHQLSFY
jgi:hypothetical protein